MRTILVSFAVLGLAACDIATAPAIPPETLLAVTNGQANIAYGQVATGDVPMSIKAPPVAYEALPTKTSCNTPKARPGVKAAYIYTYGGGRHVPLQYVNFKDTPEQAAARRVYMQEIKKGASHSAIASEAAAFAKGNSVEWSSRIDVLVTETKTPVFLYLSSYDPILWNIQLAPGARLDGVLVNSYDASMVANGTDPGRTALVSFANSPNAKCYADPDRAASLSQLIGKRPDWMITHSADGNGINAILVGPPPEAPFAVQPITRLQVPDHITPFWGTRDAAFKAFGMDT